MGSLDLGSLLGDGGSAGGTSITDQIAKAIGEAVTTALKSVLGNMS